VNVFYLESGSLKVGRVLKETGTSLQVQSQFGKQIKVKTNHVFIFFDGTSPDDFFNHAQEIAKTIDPDLLWEAFDGSEGIYSIVAKAFFGQSVTQEQEASVLIILFDNPTHFYKKGQGNFKPATAEALKAAKTSLEVKRQRDLLLARHIEQLCTDVMPLEFAGILPRLLYGPDKNQLEEKAIEQACVRLKIGKRALFTKLSIMPVAEAFHLGQFLYDNFNNNSEHRNDKCVPAIDSLATSQVSAFSIDDAATTEIDDAFSLTGDENIGWRLGVHIAAPGLCIETDSALDKELRSRMSTVYHPAGKITMSPPSIIEQFSLSQGRTVPVVSLYADIDPEFAVGRIETVIEALSVTDNLDLSVIDDHFDPDLGPNQSVDCLRGGELHVLYQLASRLREARGEKNSHMHRKEYTFEVADGVVSIKPRKRGSPVDVMVSELMIFANSHWGSELKNADISGLFRVKTKSKTGLSVLPLPHEMMGVEAYAWVSSPLRRYVDLVNQRQLIAHVQSQEPTYRSNSEELHSILYDFETKYAQYAEFQRAMERFWCVKWLLQSDQREFEAEVLRDNLVRLDSIPLVCKADKLPQNTIGQRVLIRVLEINVFDNFASAEWIETLQLVTDEPTT
jgi:exoribonuclease-2|tara:strand:+ start:462 stop:2324 length:1863 start_codon:yes stop_codon:yes gene_type:complete